MSNQKTSQIALPRQWARFMTITLLLMNMWLAEVNAVALPATQLESRAKVSFANRVELRVLPIGDSITNGTHWSSDAGGYRSRLYKAMTTQFSNAIHFVGAEHNGNFSENHHEGHSGFVIQKIQNASQYGIYRAAANVVLLHAGTNDVDHGNPADAPSNLISLIDDILAGSANTTVFVCKIIPSKKTSTQTRIEKFNDQVVNVVLPRFKGKKVVVVDMFTGFDTNNLHDDLHPNDRGYDDMADRWLNAMIANEKLVTKPGIARALPKV